MLLYGCADMRVKAETEDTAEAADDVGDVLQRATSII